MAIWQTDKRGEYRCRTRFVEAWVGQFPGWATYELRDYADGTCDAFQLVVRYCKDATPAEVALHQVFLAAELSLLEESASR